MSLSHSAGNSEDRLPQDLNPKQYLLTIADFIKKVLKIS